MRTSEKNLPVDPADGRREKPQSIHTSILKNYLCSLNVPSGCTTHKIYYIHMQEPAGEIQSHSEFIEFIKTVSIKSGDAVMIFFFLVNCFTAAGLSGSSVITLGFSILAAFTILIALSTLIALREEKKVFERLDNEEFIRKENEKERKLLENLNIPESYQSLAQKEIDKDRILWRNLKAQLQRDNRQETKKSRGLQILYAAAAFFIGGCIPFIGYFFEMPVNVSLQVSSLISLTTLFILGFGKSFYLRTPLIMGAFSSLIGGGLAGIAGYFAGHYFIPLLG